MCAVLPVGCCLLGALATHYQLLDVSPASCCMLGYDVCALTSARRQVNSPACAYTPPCSPQVPLSRITHSKVPSQKHPNEPRLKKHESIKLSESRRQVSMKKAGKQGTWKIKGSRHLQTHFPRAPGDQS